MQTYKNDRNKYGNVKFKDLKFVKMYCSCKKLWIFSLTSYRKNPKNLTTIKYLFFQLVEL